MTGINDLPSLVVATLIFLAIPGPGTIKLLASIGEASGGAKAGVWSTLGLMAGDTVWMVLALSGVAALAAANPRAFDLLRYAGAAYLAWVGFGLIRNAKQSLGADAHAVAGVRGAWQWFHESMLVSLSNPKVIGFYLAFFPLFIDQATFDGAATYARIMAVVLAIIFLYCLWLIAAAQMAKRVFARWPSAGAWLKRLAGVALIGFSVKFALQR
ncbi:MAG: LysE family translocator [Burkholderiales bacterium]|nr:LysE family translocator [Burkholderiales bacterium]